MSRSNKINPLNGKFAAPEIEAAYQRVMHSRDLRTNVIGLSIGLFILLIYTFTEFIDSTSPKVTAAIRLAAIAASIALLCSLRIAKIGKHHEIVAATISVVLGMSLVVIVAIQPSLDNNYYIGLIQGFLLLALVLRLQFTSALFALISLQIGFTVVAFMKGNVLIALLQSSNLLMVGIICAAGVYLIQRYQRADFLKSQTIEEQNTRLKALLEDVQRDNERKIAALNLLVHFVKTPLHQINGFSDIVLNSLNSEEGSAAHEQGVEGARYIKNATANLSKSVNSLLTYHRLDEVERSREYDTVDLDAAFADLGEMICADTRVKIDGKAGALLTVPMAVKTVAQCLAGYYNESLNGATSLEVTLSRAGDAARIVVADNGRTLTREEFVEKTKPLTKIDSYLTSAGAQLPMLLRTVARAVELCGGEFGHAPLGAGNEFVITLREARPAAVMADRIAAA